MFKQYWKQFHFVAILLFLNNEVKSTVPSNSQYFGEVIFSHVIFRHGDRMPIDLYPTDPNKDADWPFELAQLTDIGKRQQYELGRWLRQRYSHLLNVTYKNEEIYIESTDIDRTLMSAECNLAGLYQPTESQEWNPYIHWQPIPIHTVPIEMDVHLGAAATAPCPLYDLELLRVLNTPEVQKISNGFKDMFIYATEHSGMEINDFVSAVKLLDTLYVEDKYNFTLPAWSKQVYPEPLTSAGLYSFTLPTGSRLLQRLKIGPLLGEIVKHFQEKRDGTLTPNRNIWVYSAHDITIASILNTFGSFDFIIPPYSSSLMLELRLKDNEYFVTMFYRNSTTHQPFLLPIMDCNTLCPLNQFISLIESFIPSNWEEECNSFSFFIESSRFPSNCAFIILAVSVSSLIILFISLMRCWMKNNPQGWYYNIRPSVMKATKCKEVISSS